MKQYLNNNIPISRSFFKKKTQDLKSGLKINNFYGSNDWLNVFKKRNDIVSFVVKKGCGYECINGLNIYQH